MRLVRQGHKDGALKLPPRELPWLNRLEETLETLPATETEFIGEMMGQVDTSRFVAADYGLG